MAMNAFNYTYRKVQRSKVLCAICYETMELSEFAKSHARETHGLCDRDCCVYCLGSYSWDRKGKMADGGRHYEHLRECLKSYLDRWRVTEISSSAAATTTTHTETAAFRDERMETDLPPPAATEDDDATLEECCVDCARFRSSEHSRRWWGRQLMVDWDRAGFYAPPDHTHDSFWIDESVDVPFDAESGLRGRVASGMLRMCEEGSWKFLHVFVRPCAYARFLEVNGDETRGRFAISPFGCLCDGSEKTRYGGGDSATTTTQKTHRHMIVATNLTLKTFERKWRRVRCARDGKDNHNCKASRHVDSPLHLAYAIRYVSQPRSGCGGRAEDLALRADGTLGRRSHFLLFSATYPHSMVAMCCTRPGLLAGWIRYQLRPKNISEWPFEEFRDRYGNVKHRVRLGDAHMPVRNCAIRLDPEWETGWIWQERDLRPDRLTLYLMDGVRLHVQKKRENDVSPHEEEEEEDPETRLLVAVNKGVAMTNAVDDSYYLFGKTQNATAGDVKRAVERAVEKVEREKLRQGEEFVRKIQQRDEQYLSQIRKRDEDIRKRDEDIRKRDEEISWLRRELLEANKTFSIRIQ